MKVLEKDVNVVELETTQIAESQVSELNELQLALVGGGCGEVVFH